MAHCEHPQFAIVPAGVGEIQRIAAEDLCGILKNQARALQAVVARLTGSHVIFI
jgi:hypothetical protein